MEISLAIDLIKMGDLESLRILLGDPMDVMSSCLRAVIAAPPGRVFYGADYASIEVRVLFWIAEHSSGLRAINEKNDLYKEMASKIFRVSIENVTKVQRQIGKNAVLGCGYGMGATKFEDTCARGGQIVTPDLAVRAVESYRELHSCVPKLWRSLEHAAISAVKNPGKVYTINKISWFVDGKFLRCKLPSGRINSYYDPQVTFEKKKWGGRLPTISYMGVNPVTKKWCRGITWGGKLTENTVQGIARDLLADSHFRLEKAGYPIVLHVHDENLSETGKDFGSVEEYSKIMAENPPWAAGCPIDVEGAKMERYEK